jgi:hypothetical protein
MHEAVQMPTCLTHGRFVCQLAPEAQFGVTSGASCIAAEAGAAAVAGSAVDTALGVCREAAAFLMLARQPPRPAPNRHDLQLVHHASGPLCHS